MDIFKLTRSYWDFSFSNPEKIKPIHTAIYFFAIEHCNRLAWKEKFGFPTSMAMEAIGISNYGTYKKGLNDLVDWGFIKMIEVSKNQYSSNIISLIQFVGSTDKALDKALIKHGIKHTTKQHESIASIDIQDTSIQDTSIQVALQPNEYIESISYLKKQTLENIDIPEFAESYKNDWIAFIAYWTEKGRSGKIRAEGEKTFEIRRRWATWMSRKKETYQKSVAPKRDIF